MRSTKYTLTGLFNNGRSVAVKPAAALLLLVVFALLCPAQLNPWRDDPPVGVFPPTPITVHRGRRVIERLSVVVRPGFWIGRKSSSMNSPLAMKLTWSGVLETKSITYPTPEKISAHGQTLQGVHGEFPIETTFAAAEQTAPGSTVLYGTLVYQACSNWICLKPASVDVSLAVNVD
ncbi:MAG: hypothetical protein JO182_04335 [Acidobacteriaceae bacterium]|nr:hypothetical protein [Acidobacteriaceae bacterium]MBV9033701.1 hypothetical protein [Acidobacteriaceae bacterium]MBV9225586.1 hypothetical protein [Acidobacteriaceae bacterium]MBV9307898.1 hypothetical protein [Acidobacteriaceae bacterium]MBV9677529.1 hypothetical protein [Acidobacteriaceae bacterium]